MGKVINRTKEILVIGYLSLAENFFTRLKGLMGKEITKNEGLLIRPCNSVHTFFMKMPIDVIFLDEEDKVIHKISNMQQRKVSPIVKGSKYVIEGYPGVFDSAEIGDKIEVVRRVV